MSLPSWERSDEIPASKRPDVGFPHTPDVPRGLHSIPRLPPVSNVSGPVFHPGCDPCAPVARCLHSLEQSSFIYVLLFPFCSGIRRLWSHLCDQFRISPNFGTEASMHIPDWCDSRLLLVSLWRGSIRIFGFFSDSESRLARDTQPPLRRGGIFVCPLWVSSKFCGRVSRPRF